MNKIECWFFGKNKRSLFWVIKTQFRKQLSKCIYEGAYITRRRDEKAYVWIALESHNEFLGMHVKTNSIEEIETPNWAISACETKDKTEPFTLYHPTLWQSVTRGFKCDFHFFPVFQAAINFYSV